MIDAHFGRIKLEFGVFERYWLDHLFLLCECYA